MIQQPSVASLLFVYLHLSLPQNPHVSCFFTEATSLAQYLVSSYLLKNWNDISR